MNDKVREELDRLAEEAAGGLLLPEAVVEFARDPATELHKAFEWDDTEAAAQFRLSQARQVVRVYVRHEPRLRRTVRAFVSLPTDRATTGGYRRTADVLDRPDWTAQLVEEVRKKIGSMREVYCHLTALDGLWPRLDAVVAGYLEEVEARRPAG